MNTTILRPTALALILSACLLGGCGGGGGSGFVRPTPPPPAPPAPAEACPAPVTSDCVVNVSSFSTQSMTGERQSDYALIKRGPGALELVAESTGVTVASVPDFRFSGGTTVEEGNLNVGLGTTLHSNVAVQSDAILLVSGAMFGSLVNDGAVGVYGASMLTGNVENHGSMYLEGTVVGDFVNDGDLQPGSDIYDLPVAARVEGHFRQSSNGTLNAIIGAGNAGYTLTGGFLTVTGRADLDGTLHLSQYNDGWGPYLLPTAPFTVHVLHADGGIGGQFAQWTTGTDGISSLTLFVTGTLRYVADDVYFDVATASAEQVIRTANAGDALTVRAAGTFDAALAVASRSATPGARLSAVQRSFLASVGTVQRLQDYAQAARTFDSLSGHGYADAAGALLHQAAMPGSDLVARIGGLQPGSTTQSWAAQTTLLASGAGTFTGQRGGYDRWFGERLLVGYSFGISHGDLRFDRSGGTVRDQSPQWDVYLRGNGNANTYVFGDVGYSHHQLNLSRQIDLGGARYRAGAQRNLDVMRAYVETGRDVHLGQSRLTPFAAMSYAVLHGAGFVEQGDTGFELVAQPSVHQRLNAAAGLRLGSAWGSASGRWTTWSLAAGYRQLLQARDDARVAFTGAPDATFRLDGMPERRHAGWLQLNLATGTERWNWRLGYDREGSDQAMSLGAKVSY